MPMVMTGRFWAAHAILAYHNPASSIGHSVAFPDCGRFSEQWRNRFAFNNRLGSPYGAQLPAAGSLRIWSPVNDPVENRNRRS